MSEKALNNVDDTLETDTRPSCRSWEPPEPSTHTVPELQELRNRIAELREDHLKRGLIRVDGRTM